MLDEEQNRFLKDLIKVRAATVSQFIYETDRFNLPYNQVEEQLETLVFKGVAQRWVFEDSDHIVYTPTSSAYFKVRK